MVGVSLVTCLGAYILMSLYVRITFANLLARDRCNKMFSPSAESMAEKSTERGM
jgi:hypothetical protein